MKDLKWFFVSREAWRCLSFLHRSSTLNSYNHLKLFPSVYIIFIVIFHSICFLFRSQFTDILIFKNVFVLASGNVVHTFGYFHNFLHPYFGDNLLGGEGNLRVFKAPHSTPQFNLNLSSGILILKCISATLRSFCITLAVLTLGYITM